MEIPQEMLTHTFQECCGNWKIRGIKGIRGQEGRQVGIVDGVLTATAACLAANPVVATFLRDIQYVFGFMRCWWFSV